MTKVLSGLSIASHLLVWGQIKIKVLLVWMESAMQNPYS